MTGAVIGALLFLVVALAASVRLAHGESRTGELYLSAVPIGAALNGIATFYLLDQLGRLGPSWANRWRGLPRYVWLFGGVGLAFALTNLFLSVAAFAR